MKHNYFSTEFLLVACTNLISFLGVMVRYVPAADVKYVTFSVAFLNAVYALGRSFVKQSIPGTATTTISPNSVVTTTTKP